MSRKKARKKNSRFTGRMQTKLAVLFIGVLAVFAALSWKLINITQVKGNDYKKQVMSQQQSDSRVLPFRRGDIVDRKGGKLAYSEKVYNLVIDAKHMNSEDGKYREPTLRALEECFPDVDVEAIRAYIGKNPNSRYKIFRKKLTYEETARFRDLMQDGITVSVNSASKDGDDKIKTETIQPAGVWFEDDYQRRYPYGSLGGDVLGFVQGGNTGFFGLEEYYNSTLNGINGREYGYMNEDAVMEDSIRPAEDGNTIVTTLDINIQSIVEKHIRLFYQANENVAREGPAADNIGVIVMNPQNGEIYAMAGYPVFDLNDPTNMDGIDLRWYLPKGVSMNSVPEEPEEDIVEDENQTSGGEGEEQEQEKEEMKPEVQARNRIWRNFCISDSYEPGSVMKPFTVAAALDAGKITGNETYQCNGYLEVGGWPIHCHNRLGDGLMSVQRGVAKSCNVVLMDIAFALGKEEWLRYNRIFNFGLRTNIDLAGEANASELTFGEDMGQTDLAVASFGQGFNVTMIQMAAGFSALINGGYYYQPHVVSRILNSEGAVVEEKTPRIYKQVISEKTSEKMREFLRTVVMSSPSDCTGWSARPAGYTEGGKTGTAEKFPRSQRNYLISFMGYIPAEDPQVLCYVVIDRPNHPMQSESTRLATVLNKDIMTEVLPYLNIFPTEPITEKEAAELAEKEVIFATGAQQEFEVVSEGAQGTGEGGEPLEISAGEAGSETPEEEVIQLDDAGNPIQDNEITYDPVTGYPLDPLTGEVLDPETLLPIRQNTSDLPENNENSEGPEDENDTSDDSNENRSYLPGGREAEPIPEDEIVVLPEDDGDYIEPSAGAGDSLKPEPYHVTPETYPSGLPHVGL